MKFIVTETQEEKSNKIYADLIYTIFKSTYPDFSDQYSESKDETEIFDSEDGGTLIFYYDWEDKSFYFSIYFLEELHDYTGLSFFDPDSLNDAKFYPGTTTLDTEKRDKFNSIVKIFASHFGFTPKKIYLHSYT